MPVTGSALRKRDSRSRSNQCTVWDERTRSVIRTIAICTFIGSLLLLDGAVVVDKDKGACIVGVDVTLGAFVTRAQIALGIVGGQSGL